MKKIFSNKWMFFAFIVCIQLITYSIPSNNIPIWIYILEVCILFIWGRYLTKNYFREEPKAFKILPRVFDIALFSLIAYILISNQCFEDPGLCLSCDRIEYIKQNFVSR